MSVASIILTEFEEAYKKIAALFNQEYEKANLPERISKELSPSDKTLKPSGIQLKIHEIFMRAKCVAQISYLREVEGSVMENRLYLHRVLMRYHMKYLEFLNIEGLYSLNKRLRKDLLCLRFDLIEDCTGLLKDLKNEQGSSEEFSQYVITYLKAKQMKPMEEMRPKELKQLKAALEVELCSKSGFHLFQRYFVFDSTEENFLNSLQEDKK